MTKSVIIYGPSGCGKTRNAHRLAEHLGLTYILDGYNGGPMLMTDTLALTNRTDLPGARSFESVMRDITEKEMGGVK